MSSSEYADIYAAKCKSAANAVAAIADDETLAVGMAIGQPPALLAAIADRVRGGTLKGLKVYYKIAMDPLATTLLADDVVDKITLNSFFIAGRDHDIIKRQAQTGRKLISFVPVHFSQLPRLFEEIIPVDTFVVTVSSMDSAGYFSLGTNNDFASTAARAERVGIVNLLVPAAELEAATYALARKIATRSPAAIAACKESFRVLSEAAAIDPNTYEYLHGLRRAVYFGPDYREGISAFVEKRPARF